VLAATAQVPSKTLDRMGFVGELSLRGELIAHPAILSGTIAAAGGARCHGGAGVEDLNL
jgi:hypothetical protein